MNTDDGKRLNETLSNRLNLPSEKRLIAPSIFIGNDCLSPEEITESRVEALIEKYEKVETKSAIKVEQGEVKKAEESIVERFKSLGLLTILSAGFIDGLNPCAFATLIFFISYLTFVGRKRKEILWVGMGFSASGFRNLFTHRLRDSVLYPTSLISSDVLPDRLSYYHCHCLCPGIIQPLRLYSTQARKTSEMKLQLPDFLKKRIHKTIRKRQKSNRYFSCRRGIGVCRLHP